MNILEGREFGFPFRKEQEVLPAARADYHITPKELRQIDPDRISARRSKWGNIATSQRISPLRERIIETSILDRGRKGYPEVVVSSGLYIGESTTIYGQRRYERQGSIVVAPVNDDESLVYNFARNYGLLVSAAEAILVVRIGLAMVDAYSQLPEEEQIQMSRAYYWNKEKVPVFDEVDELKKGWEMNYRNLMRLPKYDELKEAGLLTERTIDNYKYMQWVLGHRIIQR